MSRDLIKGTMEPMVLGILARGPTYGYDMIRQIGRLSDKELELKEGTLYPVLHAMEERGWVESYWHQSESGRSRKYYRLTAAGRQELERRTREWTAFRRSVDRVLGVECHG